MPSPFASSDSYGGSSALCVLAGAAGAAFCAGTWAPASSRIGNATKRLSEVFIHAIL
jgi:hypothetical protein